MSEWKARACWKELFGLSPIPLVSVISDWFRMLDAPAKLCYLKRLNVVVTFPLSLGRKKERFWEEGRLAFEGGVYSCMLLCRLPEDRCCLLI